MTKTTPPRLSQRPSMCAGLVVSAFGLAGCSIGEATSEGGETVLGTSQAATAITYETASAPQPIKNGVVGVPAGGDPDPIDHGDMSVITNPGAHGEILFAVEEFEFEVALIAHGCSPVMAFSQLNLLVYDWTFFVRICPAVSPILATSTPAPWGWAPGSMAPGGHDEVFGSVVGLSQFAGRLAPASSLGTYWPMFPVIDPSHYSGAGQLGPLVTKWNLSVPTLMARTATTYMNETLPPGLEFVIYDPQHTN